MNNLQKIDNILYRVSDLKKAEEFYSNVLGLKKAWHDAESQMMGFVFEQSDSEIVIHTNPHVPKFDFSYLVEDVVAFCIQAETNGATIIVKPLEVRSGKYAVVSDPDGNVIPVIDLTKFGGKAVYD